MVVYISMTLYIQRRLYVLNHSIFTMTNLPPPLEFSKFSVNKLIVRWKDFCILHKYAARFMLLGDVVSLNNVNYD